MAVKKRKKIQTEKGIKSINDVVYSVSEFLATELFDKTPATAGIAVYDGLSDSDLPKEALFLSLYSVVASILCFNRVKVKSANLRASEQYKYPNIFAIILSSSGTGKDNAINDVTRLYASSTIKRMRSDFQRERGIAINDLYIEAENFGISNKLKQQQYVDSKKPRDFHHFIQPKTSASLIQAVSGYTRLPIGGANIRIPEAADKILNMGRNNDDKEIFSIIKELYERGDLDARILKSEKDTEEITDIPINFLAYSDPKKLIGSEYGKKQLEGLLDGGFARRACISLNTKHEIVDIETDFVSVLQRDLGTIGTVESTIDEVSQKIESLYDYTKTQKFYELTTEAELLLEEYKTYCKIVSQNARGEGHFLYADEVKDRWARALRLSVSVHAIENPNSNLIDALSMQFSVLLVNRLAVSFRSQLVNEDTAYKEMLEYSLKKGDWVSKSEARNSRIFGWNAFSQRFADFLEITASNSKYRLLIERINGIGMKYKVEEVEHG